MGGRRGMALHASKTEEVQKHELIPRVHRVVENFLGTLELCGPHF